MAIMKKRVSKKRPATRKRHARAPKLMRSASSEDIFSKPLGQLTLGDLYLVGVLNERNKIQPSFAISVSLSDEDIARLAVAIAEAVDV
jgi:hypothetical protein